MTDPSFFSIHAQGMVRVAAATPRGSAGNPAANAASILDLARRGDAEGADLIVYPELSLSSYAIDDLHLQDALLDRVEAELAGRVAATRDLKPLLLVGAPLRRLSFCRAPKGAQDARLVAPGAGPFRVKGERAVERR